MRAFFKFFSSLRLTVALLAFSLLLVFGATFEQVQWGVFEVQKRYFESFFCLWQYPAQWPHAEMWQWLKIPLPGGFLLGGLLLINLCCAHFRYFRASWRKTGIVLIHAGVVLLIVSGFLTAYLQQENYMWLDVGGRANFIESFHDRDLVFIDHTDPKTDTVVSIPVSRLDPSKPISDPALPFTVNTVYYYPNSSFTLRSQNPGAKLPEIPADHGVATNRDLAIVPAPYDYTTEETNVASAVVSITTPQGPVGKWFVSTLFDPKTLPPFLKNDFPQTFTVNGHTWEVTLRPRREYLPYTLQLDQFVHDTYPGTDVPKRFESHVQLITPSSNEARPVMIYMNHPLRYGGLTFYQSSFAQGDTASMLQVVRNPGAPLPYIAVALVGLGMAVHFIWSLLLYLKKQNSAEQTRAAPANSPKQPVATATATLPRKANAFPYRSIVCLLLILIGAAIVATGFLPPREAAGYDLAAFGRLPVQYGTRVLPIDSVARNTLRILSGRTAIYVPKPGSPDEKVEMDALPWFLDLVFRPEVAARVPVFTIAHDEVLGLIGQTQKGSQRFSFDDLTPHFDDIEKAAAAANKKKEDQQKLSEFEDEISRLSDNLHLFQQMSMSFVPPGETPAKDLAIWQSSLKSGTQAVLDKDAGKPVDENLLNSFALQARLYSNLNDAAIVGLIPPKNVEDKWANLGLGALTGLKTGQISPILEHYGQVGEALRKDDAQAFNTAVASLQQDLALPQVTPKVRFEVFINSVEPFFRGAFLYVMAFLCACVSWVAWGPELRRTALWLMIFGLALHTLGLFARVYITGFGVVTSLMSALQFMGWIAVSAGLAMELIKKRGVGVAAASFVGFATLVLATSLPFGGDDLELPRAVLATNFWLWTHVTCINIGCGAMFVAGALGTGYILANTFTKGLAPENRRLLVQYLYGITCFATLFSFVGTMLGGIWADQSWGRFWGWDPKENGALMIVLWCAICLHARWGKVASERTQMVLAVGGNMVTAWTLFGVNLLGVGLHSYGFMEGTFVLLSLYWLSQVVLIILAYLPPRFWKAQPSVQVA